jgi:hypothetical protein
LAVHWFDKVKVKVKVKVTLEQAPKAQSGSRGIALLFLTSALIGGWVVKATPRPFYPRETDLVAIA